MAGCRLTDGGLIYGWLMVDCWLEHMSDSKLTDDWLLTDRLLLLLVAV